MAENGPQLEALDELLRQAWLLSDDEILSIQPGNILSATSLMDHPELANHPLVCQSEEDFLRPEMHILRVMRDPAFFPFTCKHLLGRPDGGGPLEVFPMQHCVLWELWTKQFPMLIGARGFGKSFSLALFILLKLTFIQGSKVVVAASAYRQSKVVFEYMEQIWHSSPVFRDLVTCGRGARGRESGPRRDIDRCEFVIGDSVAIFLPLGDGTKIRGLRATTVIAEEFASIREHIYTTVVQGFASVTSDPVGNMKDYARMRILKRLGFWTDEMDEEEAKRVRGNQSIVSGTAFYSFNHFYRFWREYKAIINSRGDVKKLEELFKGPVPPSFNWRAYSVIRIPYHLIPQGMMDDGTIARAKQTTHRSVYLMEYECIFSTDSDGFFPRSLVEHATVGREDVEFPIRFPSCGVVEFNAVLAGNPRLSYVIGVDPAIQRDNFSVTIIEIHPDHRRVVYCWTIVKSGHKELLRKGLTKEHDFYRHCTRKLRDLMKVFPTARIMMDAGGGLAMREALGDPDKLEEGEVPIYPVRPADHTKWEGTDNMTGLHILQMVNFRDTAWVSEANHMLKKDMEEQQLLFPCLNPVVAGMALERDKAAGRVVMKGNEVVYLSDSLEDTMMEIEEMKTELTTIVVTQTASGLEHWDTPENNLPGMARRGPLRKDRYSSLLLANMGARQLTRAVTEEDYQGSCGGGFAANLPRADRNNDQPLYRAPAWFTEYQNELKGTEPTTTVPRRL